MERLPIGVLWRSSIHHRSSQSSNVVGVIRWWSGKKKEDHHQLMTTVPSESFLGKAEAVAEENVKAWARAVLREVALQSLRESLLVEEKDDDDGAAGGENQDGRRLVVKLSDNAVGAARELCQAVGTKWVEKIHENGHVRVGEWIRSLLEVESESLFYTPPLSESDASAAAPKGRSLEGSLSASTHADQGGIRRDENQAVELDQGPGSLSVTAGSRLQMIGGRQASDAGSEPMDVENAIEMIEDLAARRETDWPYHWDVIQRKCDEVPYRLHNSKREKTELVLVPKSALNRRDGDSNGTMSELQDDEADEFILQRKRKSRHKIQQSRERSMPRTGGEHGPSVVDDSCSIPRSASLLSHVSWSRDDRSLSSADQKYLEESFVPTAEASAMDDSTVLGSLRDAGRFHHFFQSCADRASSEPGSGGTLRQAAASTGLQTIRQLKWQKRGWIKERLGDHRLLQQDTREAGQVSRILRTVDRHGRRWLDFDLGHCLLDVADSGHPAGRKLYYLDSLEVALLDEDSPDPGTILSTRAG